MVGNWMENFSGLINMHLPLTWYIHFGAKDSLTMCTVKRTAYKSASGPMTGQQILRPMDGTTTTVTTKDLLCVKRKRMYETFLADDA